MAFTIHLPTNGLSLSEFPTDLSKKRPNSKQAIEIASLGDTSLDHIISSIRDGVEATVLLGKKPAIFLDKKAVPIKTIYQPQSLLFRQSKDSDKLQLAASLDLKDLSARMKLAKSRDIDMNDPAILALQASMAQVKEQKDANQTIVVNPTKLTNTKNGRSALASLKDHRKGMFGGGSSTSLGNSVSRSTPASPAIGGMTPQPVKRDAKTIKQEALKRPFIHLLAVRAVSEAYMAKILHVSKEDLAPLLVKYGKPAMDGTKYNLSDRGYKELDPWAFEYKEESDRNGVIERAVVAFDRLRVSVNDPLWQKLYKKEDRGKGNTLSKLANLHNGPIDKVKTPKIQLETLPEDTSNSNDRGRLLVPSNNTNTAARSKSQEGSKKTALASTPMVKSNSSKPAAMGQNKSQKPVDKKEPVKKAEVKKTAPKKQASKPSTTSTKVKSAEFIENSDEEVESDEIATTTATSQQNGISNKRKADEDLVLPSKKLDTKKPIKSAPKQPVEKKTIPKPKPLPSQAPKPVKQSQEDGAKAKTPLPASQPPSSTTNKKRVPESHRPVPMARTISAKKGNPLVKPSPLGSSPPTNASDMEQEKVNKAESVKSSSSSSSGSPLFKQRQERLEQKAKQQVNQISSSPSLNSDRNLKRRVNDLEKGNHVYGGFSTRDVSSSSASSDHPSKRAKLIDSSPSASESDQKSTTSSNTSPSLVLSVKELDYARSFKQQWQEYTSALRELQALSDPPAEKVERLHSLYERLKAHKAKIYSWDKKETT